MFVGLGYRSQWSAGLQGFAVAFVSLKKAVRMAAATKAKVNGGHGLTSIHRSMSEHRTRVPFIHLNCRLRNWPTAARILQENVTATCPIFNACKLYVAVPFGFQVNTRAPAERTCSKEYYAIFSVAYKLIIGFAAVGIINAVFMQETFKVAASDDKLMMRQKAGT